MIEPLANILQAPRPPARHDGAHQIIPEATAMPAIRTILRLLGACLLAASPALAEQPADLIITGATVWTVDRENPRARGVAIRDGRIIHVGDDQGALAHRGPDTRVIDADGAFVMPGFNDSHI
ncbi:MAG: hypothetical protein ACE5EV_06500, partial [Gaiellales bacterium]